MSKLSYKEEVELLNKIYIACQTNPGFITKVVQAATTGVEKEITQIREQAADMETLAAVAFGILSDGKRVSAKTKQYFENLAISKLGKYYRKTSCNWDWAIKKKDKDEE